MRFTAVLRAARASTKPRRPPLKPLPPRYFLKVEISEEVAREYLRRGDPNVLRLVTSRDELRDGPNGECLVIEE